ncbi:hypothetical protein BDY21DRAFT_2504 [Lineolata rhizophorae]|uniref:Uncharacterized protein n=1 Tax=Lineolata rhizophorae TaxID=578093 RepID=A0A6A6PEN8_9PEZI|nr:hypothetical protein BDY21DRAFT_2504 [Lineolata rhizophorae]
MALLYGGDLQMLNARFSGSVEAARRYLGQREKPVAENVPGRWPEQRGCRSSHRRPTNPCACTRRPASPPLEWLATAHAPAALPRPSNHRLSLSIRPHDVNAVPFSTSPASASTSLPILQTAGYPPHEFSHSAPGSASCSTTARPFLTAREPDDVRGKKLPGSYATLPPRSIEESRMREVPSMASERGFIEGFRPGRLRGLLLLFLATPRSLQLKRSNLLSFAATPASFHQQKQLARYGSSVCLRLYHQSLCRFLVGLAHSNCAHPPST